MTKSELRNIYKQKRSELTSAEKEERSVKILENVKQMDIWSNSVFHCFLPIESQNEINTFPLIDYLFKQNKRLIVPKVDGLDLMNSEIQTETEFILGKFKTLEPKEFQIIKNQEIEVVFLPMLVCDKMGNRLGYGGGYYDRWLGQFEKQPLKIGLNFFPPIERISDVEESDIPLDYSVSSEEIVSFTASRTSLSSEK